MGLSISCPPRQEPQPSARQSPPLVPAQTSSACQLCKTEANLAESYHAASKSCCSYHQRDCKEHSCCSTDQSTLVRQLENLNCASTWGCTGSRAANGSLGRALAQAVAPTSYSINCPNLLGNRCNDASRTWCSRLTFRDHGVYWSRHGL